MPFKGLLIRASEPRLIGQILKRTTAPTGTSDAERKERRELLAFLGAIVIAGERGLHFDGSVRDKDLDEADLECRELQLKDFKRCHTSPGETMHAACNAINVIMESGALQKILESPPPISARFKEEKSAEMEEKKLAAMKKAIQEFDAVLLEIASFVAAGDCKGLAEIAEGLAANSPLWGNKFLSGMALSFALYTSRNNEFKTDPHPLIGLLEAWKIQDQFEKRYHLVSACINTFRPYLLPGIAARNGCIFSSSEGLPHLAEYEQVLLHYLGALFSRGENKESIVRDLGFDPDSIVLRLTSDDDSKNLAANALSSIGLSVIRQAKSYRSRSHLIEAALELSADSGYRELLSHLILNRSGMQWDTGIATLSVQAEKLIEDTRDFMACGPIKRTRWTRFVQWFPDSVSILAGCAGNWGNAISGLAKAIVNRFPQSTAGEIRQINALHFITESVANEEIYLRELERIWENTK